MSRSGRCWRASTLRFFGQNCSGYAQAAGRIKYNVTIGVLRLIALFKRSHETLYNVIYAQPRGELMRELIDGLRTARAKRWLRSGRKNRRG